MWSCALLRASMVAICMGATTLVFGQNWTLVTQTPVPADVVTMELEDSGSLLLGTRSGAVFRYNPAGSSEEVFSEMANSPVSDLVAWNPLRIFIFYRDLQRFALMDRFNTRPVWFDMPHYEAEYAQVVTPGTDNSLWILATASNELKKYDLQNRQLLAATPLRIDLREVTDMVAHKNLIILADKSSGIHFFDQFGNLLRSVKMSGIKTIQLLNGELYLFTANASIQTNPFLPAMNEPLLLPKGTLHLWKDARTLLVYRNGMLEQYTR